MPLVIHTHNLLTDRRPPARNDACLRDRRALLGADKLRTHPIFAKHSAQRIPTALHAADAHGVCGAAERRRIVRDICRTTCNDALLPLPEDEHGRFA